MNQLIQVKSRTWTHIPGTLAVDIYPVIHKPCFMCSSTFVLRTPKEIIIIDPGGDRMETERTGQLVSNIAKEKGLPVFIFLTHCHIDHILSMPVLTDREPGWKIVCHELTARILEEKNEALTMANMVDIMLPDIKVTALFFEESHGSRGIAAHPLVLTRSRVRVDGHKWVDCQSFPIGDGDVMEVIHTPGHSPDSVIYRVGYFLFTGDLHCATSPGAAGLQGWDNRKLALSAEAVREIGRREKIQLVIPSHGFPFSFEQAERIFMTVRRDALRFLDIALLNRARADYMAEYARVLLEEASTTFSIIAGRLLKTSYYLEMLEEKETAWEIMKAIDIEGIDRVTDQFFTFLRELKGEAQVSIISKAVQFTRDVEKIFEPEKIHYLFDGFLLHRLRNLFIDFVNAAYGMRFQNQETVFDMNRSIRELWASLKSDRRASGSIFESLESDEEYKRELARRIAYVPLFSTLELDARLPEEPSVVHADEAVFQDAVSSLLEQFAISGTDVVSLWSVTGDEKVQLKIAVGKREAEITLRHSKHAYLEHAVRMAGGSFRLTEEDGTRCYIFELGLADAA
ncbi:MAG: beta-lactamase domain protein [Deltaproteobacteria bacterium]|nr:beta-lactamase domain protein [Deltaproteobacteria bacterium]